VKMTLKRHARMLLSIWPPFLGAGIRINRLASDWKEIDVEMKASLVELKLCRHPLRRLAVLDGRPVLYGHAD
jgi:hypothetical protein